MGQISLFTLVPEHDFGMLLVTNSSSGSQMTQKVTNLALNEYLGLETPKLTPMKTSERKLIELVGKYKATLTSAEVTMSGGKLYISQRSLGGFPTRDTPPTSSEPSPPVRYEFYDVDHLVGLDEPFKDGLGSVLRNPKGGVEWLRLGLRIHKPV